VHQTIIVQFFVLVWAVLGPDPKIFLWWACSIRCLWRVQYHFDRPTDCSPADSRCPLIFHICFWKIERQVLDDLLQSRHVRNTGTREKKKQTGRGHPNGTYVCTSIRLLGTQKRRRRPYRFAIALNGACLPGEVQRPFVVFIFSGHRVRRVS